MRRQRGFLVWGKYHALFWHVIQFGQNSVTAAQRHQPCTDGGVFVEGRDHLREQFTGAARVEASCRSRLFIFAKRIDNLIAMGQYGEDIDTVGKQVALRNFARQVLPQHRKFRHCRETQ